LGHVPQDHPDVVLVILVGRDPALELGLGVFEIGQPPHIFVGGVEVEEERLRPAGTLFIRAVGVDADEELGVVIVGRGGPVLQQDLDVLVAGENHAEGQVALDYGLQLEADGQGDVFFQSAGLALGPALHAAVPRVDDDRPGARRKGDGRSALVLRGRSGRLLLHRRRRLFLRGLGGGRLGRSLDFSKIENELEGISDGEMGEGVGFRFGVDGQNMSRALPGHGHRTDQAAGDRPALDVDGALGFNADFNRAGRPAGDGEGERLGRFQSHPAEFSIVSDHNSNPGDILS